MERDIALDQLNQMRNEIISIYAASEKCKEIQAESEKLLNEKKNPTAPSFTLQPENTHDTLKAQFTKSNRNRIQKNSTAKRIILLINAAIMIAFSVLFFLDVFLNTNILINSASFRSEIDFADRVVFTVMHSVLSLFCIIFPLLKFWR